MEKEKDPDSLGIRRGLPIALLIVFSAALLFQLLLFNLAGKVILQSERAETLTILSRTLNASFSEIQRLEGKGGIDRFISYFKQMQPFVEIKSFSRVQDLQATMKSVGLSVEEVEMMGSGARSSLVKRDKAMVVFPLLTDSGVPDLYLIEFKLGSYSEFKKTDLIAGVTSFFYVLVLYFFTIYVFRRRVSLPLTRLMDMVRKVEKGETDKRVNGLPRNELGLLGEALNSALDSLEGKRVKMEEYVEALKKANEELTSSREQVIRMEKLATIGRLASGIAHEVGNPLMAVKGYVEYVIKNLSVTGEAKDCLERVLGETSRIEGIIKGLLAQSRTGLKEEAEVDLVMIVEDVINSLSFRKMFEGIEISRSFDEVPRALADPEKIRQVIMNILINALDSMPGGGTLSIRIYHSEWISPATPAYRERRRETDPPEADYTSLRKEQAGDIGGEKGGYVVIEVIDSGSGIRAEERDKIFDPFFTTKEPGKGTGLGLSVANAIISSYGGQISFDSEEGSGSVFRVHLPSG